MKISGWIFLAISWLVILGMFVYSMVRTLREKDQDAETKE